MENKPSKYKHSNAYVIIATFASAILFLLTFFIANALNPAGFFVNLLISVFIALGVYFSATLILKPVFKIGGVSIDTVKNGEEIRQIISHAYEDMSQIENQKSHIRDVHIKSMAQIVYDSAGSIIEYVEKNTEKISQARRFFTYYLDMTIKILKKYNDFVGTSLESEEMKKVLEQTEKALDILNQTFEQQLSKLMQNDIMDIESDVTLLENMLKTESKN